MHSFAFHILKYIFYLIQFEQSILTKLTTCSVVSIRYVTYSSTFCRTVCIISYIHLYWKSSAHFTVITISIISSSTSWKERRVLMEYEYTFWHAQNFVNCMYLEIRVGTPLETQNLGNSACETDISTPTTSTVSKIWHFCDSIACVVLSSQFTGPIDFLISLFAD